MEEEEESGGKIKIIAFFVAVILISGVLIWFVGGMLSQPIEPPKKTVQEIKVIRPPPPPPEVEEEPPPEPEVEEEVEIPEEDIPDVPDMEPPPGSQLGLDAEGGAGGDAFGLVGKKGGRSLLGSGSGSRFAWYSNIIKTEILESLYEDEQLRSKSYRIRCDIWVSKTGEINRIQMLNSTGDADIDKRIKDRLHALRRISDAPPADMNMPIKIAIQSK